MLTKEIESKVSQERRKKISKGQAIQVPEESRYQACKEDTRNKQENSRCKSSQTEEIDSTICRWQGTKSWQRENGQLERKQQRGNKLLTIGASRKSLVNVKPSLSEEKQARR